MGSEEYNYEYDAGKVVRATECNITVGENEFITSKVLVNTIFYVYNEDKLTRKRIVPANGSERVIYYETSDDENTVDNINGTVTRFSGTQTQVWNAAETTLLHCYDSTDTVLEESINGTHYKTTYSDADATETEQAKTVVTFGNKTQTTYTDGFGRISEVITKKDSTELMRQVYAYKSRTVDGEALTSEQISSIVTTVGTTTTTESYSYDANGNIRTISKNGVEVYEYIYNSLNELTCEYDYTNGKKIQYSYDALGNIRAAVTYNVTFGTNGTETAEYSNVVTYGYDDTNWADKATSFKGDSITYDASGNPTLLDGYTLSWKNGRQLASASKDGMTSSYSYDSSGIRTSKLVSDSVNYSNERKDYTTIDGRITSETVSGGGMGIESYDYTVYYVYNESCEVIGFKYKYLDYANYPNWVTENYSYVKNLQGDIVGIINDATGEQVVSYTYDAWGNITSTTGTLASTIGQYNSMRYRGYYYDTETGMYYLQSRYYNPEMRRFINADETTYLGASGTNLGFNLFAYCENNPVNYVDLTGYVVTPANVIGAVVGLVLGAVGGYFLSRFLADKIGLKGWKRTAFIVGISAIISAAAAVIGYFIGPYIAKAFKALLNGLRGLFKPKFGTQLGRLGTLTRNTKPVIKGLTDHGLKRITERGVSKALAQKIVNTGYAVAQHGGKVLYFTKEGVVVLTSTGQIVTAYTSAYFDEAMQAIVSLFYK